MKLKWIKWFFVLVLGFLAVLFTVNYPKLDIISGFAAKSMASNVFIANRTPESVIANDHDVPKIKLATVSVDHSQKSAQANVYGIKNRTAIYRNGLGAVLVPEDFENELTLVPNRFQILDTLPYPYGNNGIKDSIFENIDYEILKNAMDLAFSKPEIQKTRTVLVLYKGHLIAEQYNDDFGPDTPILGWSMTKSVMATLYGILEHQNILSVSDFAPIPEWQNDERKNITLNHLLRMQSGLEWNEDYGSISDVTKMLFLDADMSKTQQEKEAIASPAEIWNYSSGTSNVLSGILRTQFNTHQEYLDFPYAALIDKIGMHSMLLEADAVGNYVGSSYGWASTRDWAKFGQLYLNKGVWNGEQLFAPEWIDYVTKPTAKSDGEYGAHFWLNAAADYPDVPKDLFSANGYQGQYVFIIPSKELVVVRTGLAETPDFDTNAFLKEVIMALK
ncbi:MAG: serine hydrolase [Flavobacteriaceae bacterium]|nr:MAG: serine hydrolase [Flavobacteriaceae bacterium]